MSKRPAKAKRGIPSKVDNFNEWYPFIVEASDLVDKRYPIKGMDVWRPYGWKTMKLIDSLTHQEMERTEHEEVNFPLLIPENLLDKENSLVAKLKRAREEGVDPDELRDEEEEGGFKKEVYWVKHAGENELDVPMFLRPTSETAMYTMFPLWIRSHKDLPMKIYQMVNTFRYETKQTRSFIRVREIHFFEAHTAHADEECATRQIAEDLEIVDNLMHKLCLPIIKAKRPIWDTFPGAWYTIGIDAIMPNGRTLQVASCHHYRDQWAKAFDIKYENKEAKQEYCHQTTYGMSERLLGAIVGMHGDENGLILPPDVAPFQVVICPMIRKNSEVDTIGEANKIAAILRNSGLRVKVDSRDIHAGQKYYDWEIKGVPLRLDIGPRDIAQGTAFAALRTGGKEPLAMDNIAELCWEKLSEISDELRNRSAAHMDGVINELPQFIEHNETWSMQGEIKDGKIYQMPFEGTDAHAEIIEKATGLTFLGDATEDYDTELPCYMTGKMTKRRVILAKTY
ncbi:MAG TPA: proline--tRNA ligase [Candidatus Poseidoniales archaeon]|nr:MAG TPA: proline--tRNA ligase [Candidatus Poseidoniales archaeon]HII57850.1 proline--tRNA ligase [Candidatus Poseidoniaceae archaeon]|tara:strand:- start:1103 stop:2632 length:1530 start_codon:yes stop_codon:yes gene_type:complete